MKLWQKNSSLDALVEAFTVGEDPRWDAILLPYDIQASAAHCRMLAKTGLLSPEEAESILQGLDDILRLWNDGRFTITQADEDMHTAIENYLVASIGEAGKKIHTGRSRNDQVLTALRLFMRDRASTISGKISEFHTILLDFSAAHEGIPLPGYTHTRKAMPSSVSLWTGFILEALTDDRALLASVISISDKNPLGTGAGYGVPLPLDISMTTEELGFSQPHANPIQTQHSRGKYEGLLLMACSHILADLNRLASDLIFFTMPEFAFFLLPNSFTTGSSIMPQKKNPDVLELLRGAYHSALAAELQVRNRTINLISGYHRDIQSNKGVLIQALDDTLNALDISIHLFRNLKVNPDACREGMTPELFATERAYRLMQEKGLSFRDAYRIIGNEFDSQG